MRGLLLVLMLASPVVLVDAQDAGTGVEYELVIACPEPNGFSFGTGSSVVGCPVRVTDGQDQMGDPSIAVDPFEPSNLIIASLHGQASSDGPSPRSRGNDLLSQSFTTFTSEDAGAYWTDKPFTNPADLGPGTYGITPAITMDPYGHVFVGSLYATDNEGGFDYVIAAQKFASLRRIDQSQDGEYNAEFLDPVYAGNVIRQVWFLFNPATDNMTMVWGETLSAQSKAGTFPEGRTSHSTFAQAIQSQAPGRLALEGVPSGLQASAAPQAPSAPAPATTSPPRSVIGIAWTDSDVNTTYRYQRETDAIGPCLATTNPVLSDGYLYIGCVAAPDEGPFRWHPETTTGTVELFRMDPNGGTPAYLGASPIVGGAPKLGVRSDGRLALLSAAAVEDRLRLAAAFGSYSEETKSIQWQPVAEYGAAIAKPDPSIKIVGANIQDVIYREYSGVVHFILKTNIEPVGLGVSSVQNTLAPRIRKQLVALDEQHGVLFQHNLDIGNLVNRTSDSALMQAPEIAYDDLADDFLQLPEGPYQFDGQELGPAYQREFFAVGDYGQLQFAELIEITTLRGPAAVPSAVAPPPIPAAATSFNVSSVLLPVAGVSVTGLVALSLLAQRRKDPLAAMAKQKK